MKMSKREQLLKKWSDQRISYEVTDSPDLVDFLDNHRDEILDYLLDPSEVASLERSC